MKKVWLINGNVITGYIRQENCCIYVEDGLVVDVISYSRFKGKEISPDTLVFDVNGAWIAPGFIDSHLHGFGGYGTEDNNPDSIIAMSDMLAQHGVTSFCPTIYSSSEKAMTESIKAIVAARSGIRGASIMGIHLEGPFISPQTPGCAEP